MLARFGVGAAVGALPGAAAITGAAAGWCPWIVVVFAVFALLATFVVPAAPFLPVLNRVPLIGSPKFKIVLRLNGRLLDTRLRIDDWSNTSVLEVGILNKGRAASVRDAWMNLLVPSGVQMGPCDKVGRHVKGGRWEPFHPHRLGSHARADYWNDAGWTFESGLSRLVRVKLRFALTEPGEYPVCSSSAPRASTRRSRSTERSTSRTRRTVTSGPRIRWGP